MSTRADERGSAEVARSPRRRFLILANVLVVVLLLVSLSVLLLVASSSIDRSAVQKRAEAAVGHLRSVAQWEELFLQRWDYEDREIYAPLSRSADSWDHYNLAFGLDANTAMYRATGKRQYIDRALAYVTNVMATVRPSYQLGPRAAGDQFEGWTSERSDVRGEEVPLFESFFWRYATDVLQAIREAPDLWADPAYRQQYGRVLSFAELHVVDKWLSRGSDAYIYRSRTHMAAHWAYICMNLSLLTEDLARANRMREVYRNINEHLPNYDSSLRAQLQPHALDRDAYFWSDAWEAYSAPGQDVAHGNGVVAYIVEAHDRRVHWTQRDLDAFSALLTNVIWRERGSFPFYVFGRDDAGNGWVTDGFMKLGRYDRQIQLRLQEYEGAVSDNGGGLIQFYGNGALNARILDKS